MALQRKEEFYDDEAEIQAPVFDNIVPFSKAEENRRAEAITRIKKSLDSTFKNKEEFISWYDAQDNS